MGRVLGTVLVALVAVVPVAFADEPYPARPITVVILKQPVILLNKSGASGAVGMQSVAVARPDGYTILVSVPVISTLPEVDTLFARTPVFTRDQFVTIARIDADLPWKSLKELLDDAHQDADEFKVWWDKDAQTATAVIKRIGKLDPK